MVFRKISAKIVSLYKSFFNPPSYDVAIVRKERLSIGYAFSMLLLFLLSSFMLFKSLEDPERAKHAVIRPAPGATVVKLEVNPWNFSVKRQRREGEELDKENVTDE